MLEQPWLIMPLRAGGSSFGLKYMKIRGCLLKKQRRPLPPFRSESRSSRGRLSSFGFSLIELVVVIAILGVLISVAMPQFINIKKDAEINQAKSALATLFKECKVAEIRGNSTLLSDMSSAKASLPGYRLSTGQLFGDDFLAEDCFRSDLGGMMLIEAWPVVPNSYPVGTEPTKISPIFAFQYDPASGRVTRSCQVWSDAQYLAGCGDLEDAPVNCGGLGQPRCSGSGGSSSATLKNGNW